MSDKPSWNWDSMIKLKEKNIKTFAVREQGVYENKTIFLDFIQIIITEKITMFAPIKKTIPQKFISKASVISKLQFL